MPDTAQRCIIISIHSTARVETETWGIVKGFIMDFNPLHREGGDHDICMSPPFPL